MVNERTSAGKACNLRVRECKISQSRNIRLARSICQFRQSKPREINELLDRFGFEARSRDIARETWAQHWNCMHRAV
jgi:hypothetical protein